MVAQLLSFARPRKSTRGDWSTQEIAEFYRVEAALVQAGMNIQVDRGVSDEGDPWFVFCRAGDGDVIVHFARIDGAYLIVAEASGQVLKGQDFRRLLSEFVSINPTLVPIPSRNSKLLLHPASLLAAVVATALFQMSGSEAVASTIDAAGTDDAPSHNGAGYAAVHDAGAHTDRKWFDRQFALAAAAIVALATAELTQSDTLMTLSTTLVDLTAESGGPQHTVVAFAMPTIDGDAGIRGVSLLELSETTSWIVSLPNGNDAPTVMQTVSVDVAPSKGVSPTQTAMAATGTDVAPTAHGSADHSALADATDMEPRPLGDPPIVATGRPPTGPASPAGPSPLATSYAQNGAGASPTQTQADTHVVSMAERVANAAATLASDTAMSARSTSLVDPASHFAAKEFVIQQTGDIIFVVKASFGTPSTTTDLHPDTAPISAPVTIEIARVAVKDASPQQLQPVAKFDLFDDAAQKAVTAFAINNTYKEANYVEQRNYILFDTNPEHFASPDFVVKTWQQTDGSTITIIGQLPHDLAVKYLVA